MCYLFTCYLLLVTCYLLLVSRFLEQEGQTDAAAEKLDKHRFLIQSKTISDAEYDSVAAASSAQRAELVS